MPRVYLALIMLSIFVAMFSITSVKAYSTTFWVNNDPYELGWEWMPGVDPAYGEAIYEDLNLPGTTGNAEVSAGDIRLTPVSNGMGGWYPAGSAVGAADNDVGRPTYGAAARWGTVKHADNGATPSRYDFGEFIYKDANNNGFVGNGDTRYSSVPGYKVGSVVAAADTDIGTPLIAFKGTAVPFERFTDNLDATALSYDFARLFVDIMWTTNIPNNTPDGMRGWQFYCAVDPDVLTPFGWIGATDGYVLIDYLTNIGSLLTTGLLGVVYPDYLDVTEQILGTVPNGAGDMWTGGKLVTLVFIPQSQVMWSPLDLLDTSVGYMDAGTATWHTVTLVDGGYNFVVPEFPLGISALMSMVALIPVVYVWRTRPKKKMTLSLEHKD